jgi:CRISPR-associated endonuclease/helicase Cas3
VEDVTGGGKTEVALILAHRLLAAARARGLYLALPTMATANAMYDRLAASYRRLFADEETPSLALAHGSARLHEGFRESFEGVSDQERAIEREADASTERDPSGAACAAWLADESRKAFLADVGVGTIDQAFLGVLPAKYQALRLLGLAERVLIVDEAHAYDAYMGRELERLLEFQGALGGSAIVLSATLPRTVREGLASAFAKGLGCPAPALAADAYPLVSVVAADRAQEEAKEPRADLRRSVGIERLPDQAAALRRIAEAAQTGAGVAWVRNTVDDAFEGVAQLRAAGVAADLFHARFAMGDRLAIEREIVDRFGKGDPANRPGVLVATQVIEQSLDLDFDLLVSDLAPIDLLLQRAGRLWRHPQRRRPIAGPRLLVVAPDPAAEIGKDWYAALFPRAAWVYRNHALLWLSAAALFGHARVRVPEDVRALVEAVYGGGDPDSWAPPALRRNVIEALGQAQAARSLAQTNLLSVSQGYGGSADHPGWDVDTRTPTRLGEEMTTLRLARLEDGGLTPWCPDRDPHRAWTLSEVAVLKNRVTDVPEPAAAAVLRRRVWTRYDDPKKLLLLTERQSGLWQGTVVSRDGETLVTYTRREGMQFGA